MFYYPVAKQDLVSKYTDFMLQKLQDSNFRPDTIIAHSLGAIVAVNLVSRLEYQPKVILVSPLLSSVAESRVAFFFKALRFGKGSPPPNLWIKWLRNVPVFVSQLNGAQRLEGGVAITNDLVDRIFITTQDKLIESEKQQERLTNINPSKIQFVKGEHGWVLDGFQVIQGVLEE